MLKIAYFSGGHVNKNGLELSLNTFRVAAKMFIVDLRDNLDLRNIFETYFGEIKAFRVEHIAYFNGVFVNRYGLVHLSLSKSDF